MQYAAALSIACPCWLRFSLVCQRRSSVVMTNGAAENIASAFLWLSERSGIPASDIRRLNVSQKSFIVP